MSRHSRWANLETMKLPMDAYMAQYVQGYILAMEDILRDIENMQYNAAGAEAEYSNGYGDALDSLKGQVEESRAGARRTLDLVTRKVAE